MITAHLPALCRSTRLSDARFFEAIEKQEDARRYLRRFIEIAWPIVEPTTPFRDNWHVGAISEHLEAVTRGQIQRLVINIPPGHAKSVIVAVMWPAWEWTNNPGIRQLFSSYEGTLAIRDSIRCRSIIESEWYQKSFMRGDWGLSGDQNVKSYFENTKKGARMALSVGGKGTGFRGNRVVVDDPINATDAPSKLIREAAITWWDKTMSTRLNDPKRDARVIIMQRLHEEDLTGHVLEQGGYEHLCLPSEFDPAKRSITCLGVNDKRKEAGELLFPEMFPKDVLDRAKKDLGSDGYAGQHDQNPTPAEGGMFPKGWWKYWRKDGDQGAGRVLPAKLDEWAISVDAAFKGTDSCDPVSLGVWARFGADKFRIYGKATNLTFRQTCDEIRTLRKMFPKAYRVIIEDKANGPAIVDTLKSEMSGIIAVNPEGGKEARAHAVAPQVESGNVYLHEGAPWVEGYIHEFAMFPRGKHDDQVDETSQMLLYFTKDESVRRAKLLCTY